MMLEGRGQDVRAAYDGASAIQAFDDAQPDIAFIDIAMPGMDGYEVVRRLRARPGPRPTLVALTGFGQREDRDRAFEAGFDRHLVKPAGVEAVHALLSGIPSD